MHWILSIVSDLYAMMRSLDDVDRNKGAAIILEIWCHLLLYEVKPLLAPALDKCKNGFFCNVFIIVFINEYFNIEL